jgi:hypothetical protein
MPELSSLCQSDGMTGEALRQHLVGCLDSGHAHVTLERASAGIPKDLRGARPPGLAHSPWEILEHVRIAQWDILEFSRGPGHASPAWPAGYWPEEREAVDEAAWEGTLSALRADREAFAALLRDAGRDLLAPFPWGDGQSLIREALLIADHNAYHVGELVAARRALGCWNPT